MKKTLFTIAIALIAVTGAVKAIEFNQEPEQMLGGDGINLLASTTPGAVTVGSASTLVLAAEAGRKYAALVNDSDEAIYISLGNTAEMNKGIRLSANGGSYEILNENLFLGTIYAICSSGSKNLTYIEVK